MEALENLPLEDVLAHLSPQVKSAIQTFRMRTNSTITSESNHYINYLNESNILNDPYLLVASYIGADERNLFPYRATPEFRMVPTSLWSFNHLPISQSAKQEALIILGGGALGWKPNFEAPEIKPKLTTLLLTIDTIRNNLTRTVVPLLFYYHPEFSYELLKRYDSPSLNTLDEQIILERLNGYGIDIPYGTTLIDWFLSNPIQDTKTVLAWQRIEEISRAIKTELEKIIPRLKYNEVLNLNTWFDEAINSQHGTVSDPTTFIEVQDLWTYLSIGETELTKPSTEVPIIPTGKAVVCAELIIIALRRKEQYVLANEFVRFLKELGVETDDLFETYVKE